MRQMQEKYDYIPSKCLGSEQGGAVLTNQRCPIDTKTLMFQFPVKVGI